MKMVHNLRSYKIEMIYFIIHINFINIMIYMFYILNILLVSYTHLDVTKQNYNCLPIICTH